MWPLEVQMTLACSARWAVQEDRRTWQQMDVPSAAFPLTVMSHLQHSLEFLGCYCAKANLRNAHRRPCYYRSRLITYDFPERLSLVTLFKHPFLTKRRCNRCENHRSPRKGPRARLPKNWTVAKGEWTGDTIADRPYSIKGGYSIWLLRETPPPLWYHARPLLARLAEADLAKRIPNMQ